MMVVIRALLMLISTALVGGWLGLKIKPKSFPPYPATTPPLKTVPLPEGLPAPVARFYRTIIGEEIPVIDSAVITTRVKLRFNGITFPGRFRFTHRAGYDYRHYIEATIFGYPLLKVNEHYRDGQAVMELPFGVIENDPKTDMAANLGLWGESIWLPSIFITDPRVRWEAIDDQTARLVVPYQDTEDSFTVFFDEDTSLITRLEAMRYRDADGDKIRWILDAQEWTTVHGSMIPGLSSVTWEDQGQPWLTVMVEDVVYNADVSGYIMARGL